MPRKNHSAKSPKNDPGHRHSEQAPRVQRKTKPKFEVPAETVSSVTPVDWVYRTAEAPTAVPHKAAPREAKQAVPLRAAERSMTEPLFAAGMGLFMVSAAAAGLVFLAAFGLVGAPIGIATGFLQGEG
jgi:hypothetical protein